MKIILLWDLPLRVFHWSLAVLTLGAVITGLVGGGLMEWHGRIGAAIAGLLGFRFVWGFVGSPTARFTAFVAGPQRVFAYLRGHWRGVGHNPLGAWSVLAMLATLAAQVATGLFGDDDIAFRGPYNVLVGGATEILAVALHKRLFWLLAALLVLHLAAIAYYTLIRRDNLAKPMLTGVKEVPLDHLPPGLAEATQRGRLAGLAFALAFAGFTAWTAHGGPLTYLAPPPPPPAETPSW